MPPEVFPMTFGLDNNNKQSQTNLNQHEPTEHKPTEHEQTEHKQHTRTNRTPKVHNKYKRTTIKNRHNPT